jgi:hypothetical protein
MLNFVSRHRYLVVVIGLLFLFIMVVAASFFVPVYGEYCGKNEYTNAKECATYHIALAFFWQVIKATNDYGSALTALATIVVAAFTGTLWWVGAGQYDILAKQYGRLDDQIKLARQEFIATHRPKVIVRFIQGFSYDDDLHEIIFVTVVNTGVNSAIIREFGCDLGRRKDGHWLGGIDGTPKAITPVTLKSGERHTFTVRSPTPYGDAEVADDAWAEICAVGRIRYADESNVVRETGFFRTYNRESEAFVRSHDAGEEYQD